MKPRRHIALLRLARLPLALAAAFALAAPAHTEEPLGAVYSIVVPYGSSQQLGQLTKLLDHPYVDQKTNVVKAEVGAEELAAVRSLGFVPQIDQAETARIQNFIATRTADMTAGKLTDRKRALSIANGVHSCYRTVEEVYHTFDEIVAAHPGFAKTGTLGKSWMGTQQVIPPVGTAVPDNSRSSFANLLIRFLPASIVTRFNLSLFPVDPSPVRVLVIGNFAKQDAKSEPPPNMVWTGGIHAREYAPQEVGIKFLEWLLDNYQTDPNARMMLDNNRYHFIVHNPDGRKLAEQDISARQRKNTNYVTAACTTTSGNPPVLNTLSSGVDLNRNYPFGWATGGAGGSDGNVCGETYRGIGPASEPETQAVMNYVRGTWNQATCKWEGGALPDGRPKSTTYCNPTNRDNNGTGELDWKGGAPDTYGGGVFIDLHSNARAVLWPWGVERTENDFNTHSPEQQGHGGHRPAPRVSQQLLVAAAAQLQHRGHDEGRVLRLPRRAVVHGRDGPLVLRGLRRVRARNLPRELQRLPLPEPGSLSPVPAAVRARHGQREDGNGARCRRATSPSSPPPSTTTVTATRTPARPTSCRRRIRSSTTSPRPRRTSTSCRGRPAQSAST